MWQYFNWFRSTVENTLVRWQPESGCSCLSYPRNTLILSRLLSSNRLWWIKNWAVLQTVHLSGAAVASTHGLSKRTYDCLHVERFLSSWQPFWMTVVFHCLGDCLNIIKALRAGSMPSAMCQGGLSLWAQQKNTLQSPVFAWIEEHPTACATDKRPLCNVCRTAWPPSDSHKQAALHNKENPAKTILEAWSRTKTRRIMISVCTTDGDFRVRSY